MPGSLKGEGEDAQRLATGGSQAKAGGIGPPSGN